MTFIAATVDPIDRDIALIIEEELSPRARNVRLAEFAREALADAIETNTRAMDSEPRFTTFVDGSEGRRIEDVRPDGVIRFEFDLIAGVLRWIDEELRRASPRLTGRYERSHILLADEVEVDPTAPSPEASEFVFISTVPYARKIEGDDHMTPESRSAPSGVYNVVAKLAAGRFGNVVTIGFDWRSLQGSLGLEDWARQTRRVQHRRGFQDWLRRQPAIVIKVH